MAHREIKFFLVLLAAFISVGYARAPKKLLNGENASILDFPYMAIVKAYLSGRIHYNFCAGTIIDAKHILTAAHCLYEKNSTIVKLPQNIDVFTGIDNLNQQSTIKPLKVQRVIPHSDYNIAGESENDIAILKLNESISFNSARMPAALPNEDISEGTEATVAGWGYRTFNYSGPLDPELQKIRLTVYNARECSLKMTWYPRSSKICTMSRNGGGACPGDSGSPLIFNGTVIGVASRSLCRPGYPTTFTNVYSYLSWINSTVGV